MNNIYPQRLFNSKVIVWTQRQTHTAVRLLCTASKVVVVSKQELYDKNNRAVFVVLDVRAACSWSCPTTISRTPSIKES